VITIEEELCTQCGVCTKRFKNYCIGEVEKRPVIRYDLCNQCQRCISICPQRAIRMDGVEPERIDGPLNLDPRSLEELMARRRSTKRFRKSPLPWETVREILRSASYAPNQNKNIEFLVIDDPAVIDAIDNRAIESVKRWHRVLFGFKPATALISVFTSRPTLHTIRVKMEYDCRFRKRVIKDNAPVIVLALGDSGVPVTGDSAQYLLANVILMAEAVGVGSCLMDSLKRTINGSRSLKRALGIGRRYRVLAALLLGYSDEPVVNIPRGYEIPVCRNRFSS